MANKYILPNVDYGRDLDAHIDGAPNFQYWEFVSSEIAVRHGIANIPSEQEWQNIEYLARTLLQPLRVKFGKPITINSGFRCKQLNDLVGSTDASFHRQGCAADCDSDDGSLMEMLELAVGLPYTEIICEFYPHGWNHLAVQRGRTDSTLKLKDDAHNYAKVDITQIQNIYCKVA